MDWFTLAICLLASGGAASTGAMFPPGMWYQELDKPPWVPPNWAFPVVWTVLYIASSVAAARVSGLDGGGLAMAFWAMQIAFNTLWSPVFFGLRNMRASLVVMAFLWIAVAGTMISFFAVDPLSGFLFVPYLAWVSVAGALNYSVYARNPDVRPIAL
ncbi:MAG: TspO/MBR family protein [Pseudomonadota bacterium]